MAEILTTRINKTREETGTDSGEWKDKDFVHAASWNNNTEIGEVFIAYCGARVKLREHARNKPANLCPICSALWH
jgi:hypothetical protein